MRRTGTGGVLALDSSSRRLTFAFRTPEGKVSMVETDKNFRHAESVLPNIVDLLSTSELGLDSVGCIVVGIGPGSFTGLRVGLATVKALMLSRKIPCLTVSSLDVIAHNAVAHVGDECVRVRVLVDARRSRYYTALYECSHGVLTKLGPDQIIEADILRRSVRENTVFLGDGLGSFSLEGSDVGRKGVRLLPETTWYPRASVLAKLVEEDSPFLVPTSIRELKPAYLCLTEPEERLIREQRSREEKGNDGRGGPP